MDTLNGAPDGASVRSRSPSRSLEVAPQHPPTTPIRVTESQELVITPDVVAPVDTSCPGCLAPTRRLKHTCTKARSENKRHTSPSVDSRHAKRSGTGSAPALTATEAVQISGASLAIDFGSDVGVRAGEMHVLSEAPSHISSSSLAPTPSHMPVPTPHRLKGRLRSPRNVIAGSRIDWIYPGHASWRVAFLVRFFGFDMFAAARAYQISGRNVCQGNLTLVGILTSARMIRPCANAGVQ